MNGLHTPAWEMLFSKVGHGYLSCAEAGGDTVRIQAAIFILQPPEIFPVLMWCQEVFPL